MALTVPDILNIARVSGYLAADDIAKGSFGNGLLDRLLNVKIYVERKAIEWIYNNDPTDTMLLNCANYLYSLCGAYALRAQLIINGGATGSPVIPITPYGGGTDWILITGDQLTGGITYNNTLLDGKSIRVFDTSIPNYLVEGTQFTLVGGTLSILTGGTYTSADRFYIDLKGAGSGSSSGGGCCPTLLLTLTNYNEDTDLEYPLGVISVTGALLGIADDATEYMNMWNANTDNQEVGEIISGLGTEFEVQPIYINSIVNLFAMEYYTMTGPNGNKPVYADEDDIVECAGVIRYASVSGVVTDTDTQREFNGIIVGGANGDLQQKCSQISVRLVTVTSYLSTQTIYVFHNRTSRVAGIRLSSGSQLIAGILPTGITHFFWCGQKAVTDYRSVTNWSDCSSLQWFILVCTGGGVWGLDPTKLPTLNTASLKGISIGGFDTSEDATVTTWINALGVSLQQIQIIVTTSGGNTNPFNDATLMNAIPAANGLLNFFGGSGTATDVNVDARIISLATLLNGITPITPAKIKCKSANTRTAASDVAYNYLVAQGWTITLL